MDMYVCYRISSDWCKSWVVDVNTKDLRASLDVFPLVVFMYVMHVMCESYVIIWNRCLSQIWDKNYLSEHDDCNRFGPVNFLVKNCMDFCVDLCSRHASSGSCVFPPIVFRRRFPFCFSPSRFHNKLETHVFGISPPQDGANNSDSEIGAVFGVFFGIVFGGKLAPLLVHGVQYSFCYPWGNSCRSFNSFVWVRAHRSHFGPGPRN